MATTIHLRLLVGASLCLATIGATEAGDPPQAAVVPAGSWTPGRVGVVTFAREWAERLGRRCTLLDARCAEQVDLRLASSERSVSWWTAEAVLVLNGIAVITTATEGAPQLLLAVAHCSSGREDAERLPRDWPQWVTTTWHMDEAVGRLVLGAVRANPELRAEGRLDWVAADQILVAVGSDMFLRLVGDKVAWACTCVPAPPAPTPGPSETPR